MAPIAAGKAIAFLGICYEAIGGSEATAVTFLEPELEVPPGSYFVASISGAIKGLPAGSYDIGACTHSESNVIHGFGWASAIVAETR
jgi:hypothetical protein